MKRRSGSGGFYRSHCSDHLLALCHGRVLRDDSRRGVRCGAGDRRKTIPLDSIPDNLAALEAATTTAQDTISMFWIGIEREF